MGRLDEHFSKQFHRWEQRGRGWQVHPQPVAPEPAFESFTGHYRPDTRDLDDGRKPTAVSSLLKSFWAKPAPPAPEPEPDEPEPAGMEREPPVELTLHLPPDFTAKPAEFSSWLSSLSACAEPVTFELIGTPEKITAQLAVSAADEEHIQQQLRAFFPDLVASPATGTLEAVWQAAEDGETAIVEFGLAQECLLPLATVNQDLCVPLTGALGDLTEGECAVFQVIFQPVVHPWAESLVNAVTDGAGKAFFVNAPELVGAAERKTARPLFAAVVRVAVRSPDFERAWEIVRHLASALRAFAVPNGNELIPLHNHDYPFAAHCEDVPLRQSRRSGMLLNADELPGFIRFPTGAVRTPKLSRLTQRSKPAPELVNQPGGYFLGWNHHLGNKRGVWLTAEQRVNHMHLIGASGTGKSTLLFNLIRQDIERGQGVGVLDPHGDLITKILGVIPPERIKDVVLLDPSDEQFIVGFNILSAHSDWEKNLLASDLVSIFRRLSTSWGDQMGSVLNNAILAFLESETGGTLDEMRRFLIEPAFRERFLKNVRDPNIVYYWQKGFPQLGGNKSIGPILTRLDMFLNPKPLRYMVAQAKNTLDFGAMLDTGKIFLAKISQGDIGQENSYLLGSLLVAKFHQLAMSRQRQQASARKDFWLYLDEFQDFITPSMAAILSGARKYRIGLTLAHQELRQLQRDADVSSAVLSNAFTRVCFRVGDQDARALESGFSFFEARDLQNLSNGEAICRVQRSDFDFNLAVPWPDYPDDAAAAARRNEVIMASREKYATPRAEVEAALLARADVPAPPASKKPDVSPPTPATPTPAPATEKVATPVQPMPSAAIPPSAPAPVTETAPTPAAPTPTPAHAAEKVAPPVQPMPSSPVPPPAPVAAPVPAPEVTQQPKPDAVLSEMGRGGMQHKAIQARLKAGAEALGFRVFVEKRLPDGAGDVDLVFERDGMALACEIGVTTTTDHEVGNVAKCIKAGFEKIAAVRMTEDKLADLAAAVATSLGADAAAKVSYHLPDALLAYLESLPPIAPAEPAEPTEPAGPITKTVRGYKVKTSYTPLSPEEDKAREDAMIKKVAESMKKPARRPAG
jgi:hypothetical protein